MLIMGRCVLLDLAGAQTLATQGPELDAIKSGE